MGGVTVLCVRSRVRREQDKEMRAKLRVGGKGGGTESGVRNWSMRQCQNQGQGGWAWEQ